MIIMGAGVNHWYNNDVTYRAMISLTTLCGCQGVSGGGWAHYVGQEKVRPLAGWTTVTVGSDWMGPPRLHNGTSFYYFALDSWRHELLSMDKLTPPDRKGSLPTIRRTVTPCRAARLAAVLPAVQGKFLETCEKGGQAGAASNEEIVAYTLERLKSGDLELSVDAPDDPANVPRVMVFWRANPLGSTSKGMNTSSSICSAPKVPSSARRPASLKPSAPRPEPDSPEGGRRQAGPHGDVRIRMSTTCVYSDIVLPAAHWYEYHDLSSTDMHPFIHPFNLATDRVEARTNWDQFKAIAQKFLRTGGQASRRPQGHVVATALLHDTPGEIGQPFGEVRPAQWATRNPYPARRCLISRSWSGPIPTSTRCTPRSAPTSPSPAAWREGVSWSARRNTNSLRRVSAWFPSRASAKVCPASTTPRTPVKSCWPCPRKAMAMWGCARGPGWKSRPVSSSTIFPARCRISI
ncbi:MAG: molybdopterin-dependent oxidoreductase [Bilophila wadsworthia]